MGKHSTRKEKKISMDSAIKSWDDIAGEADRYLNQLETLEISLSNILTLIEMEIKAVQKKYAIDLAIVNDQKKVVEKDLKIFAKKNKKNLFGESDKVFLTHGILLYSEEDKVTIPRDALEKIEALGWKDGIKTEKNIDRPAIEKWNDEKLAAIGASKKLKREISWELKDRKKEKRDL